MVFLLYPVVAAATAAVGAATYVYYQRPVIALKFMMRLAMKKAGMTVSYRQLGGATLCYAERGVASRDRSSIIFVHGFTSSKDNWLSVIERLPKDLHLVAVDLLGHGESSIPPTDGSTTAKLLMDKLHELLTVTGMLERPVHLVGTSMGGLISTMFTAEHPSHVELLTIICPAVFTPIDSKYRKEFRPEQNFLIPRTLEDVEGLLNLLLFHKEKLPRNKQILKSFLQLREPRTPFFTELFESLSTENLKEEAYTKTLFSRVRHPTQIIWGANDDLVDLSGAEYLRGLLPDCRRVDIVPECGHAITWDEPTRITACIAEFRANMQESRLY